MDNFIALTDGQGFARSYSRLKFLLEHAVGDIFWLTDNNIMSNSWYKFSVF